MSEISLNASMRSNLLSLQQTQMLQDMTQLRLSTGLKVNSAIDNPSSYYTASSLNNRAKDLSQLLNAMGQGIQTIKAANEALETGTILLQQLKAVTNQALTQKIKNGNNVAAFEAEGYTVITSTMSTDDIQALITNGAKLVLKSDITLSKSLNINADNITIEGNGHKISYSTSTADSNLIKVSAKNAKIHHLELAYANTAGGSAISVDGATASANISLIKITAAGTKVYGIRALNKASVTLDNTLGLSVSGTGSQKLVNGNAEIYDGKNNTQAIVNQIGADGLAATAATQFYVGSKNGDFGQGEWYLPSIGELTQIYGHNSDAMTDGIGSSGATGVNKNLINTALGKLGADAAMMINGYYWSSSESSSNGAWLQLFSDGYTYGNSKDGTYYVRPILALENGFNPLTTSVSSTPKIGDIMYDDKTWGSADDYASRGGKTAVGVITDISADGSLKLMALKDLRFSSKDNIGNFDPENPFSGSVGHTYYATAAKYSEDITNITNYNPTAFLNAMKSGGAITVTQTPPPNSDSKLDISLATYSRQYNSILLQYDNLMQDASYKGVNLLQGNNLKLNFNKELSSGLDINGVDASTRGLDLLSINWVNQVDVEASVSHLESAINQIRSFSAEFGNYYSIVISREEFTQNMINVLTEGADKLTLADMNEESANMLAMQTRQQLAINSLSLASQASRSVLNLF